MIQEERNASSLNLSINVGENSLLMMDENSHLLQYLTKVAKVSVPTIITYEIQTSIMIISTYFLGKLNKPIYLATFGIANNWLWMALLSLIVGFGGSIDTLCAQAFGAKNSKLFSKYFNSSSILILIIQFPLLIITWFSSFILQYILGYPHELAISVETYLRYQFPGICSIILFELMRRYLRAQQVFFIQVIASAISSILHLFFCILFTQVLGFGFRSIAISYSICTFFSALIVYLFIITKAELKERWKISWNSLFYEGWVNDIKEIWPIAWHSAALCAGEYWGFFLIGFETAYFGEIQMGAYVILFNYIDFLFNFCNGSSQALTACVGASIGANLPKIAKKYVYTFFSFVYVFVSIFYILLLIYAKEIAELFTRNNEIIKIVTSLIPLILIAEIGDIFQCLSAGTIRAIGKQKQASYVSIIIHGLFQQILIFIIAFGAGLQVYGVMVALCICCYLSATIYFIILVRENWEEIAFITHQQLSNVRPEHKEEVLLKDLDLSSSALLS